MISLLRTSEPRVFLAQMTLRGRHVPELSTFHSLLEKNAQVKEWIYSLNSAHLTFVQIVKFLHS